MTLTLWDLIDSPSAPPAKPAVWIEPTGRGFPTRVTPPAATLPEPTPLPLPANPKSEIQNPKSLLHSTSMESRYEAVTRLMLKTHGVRVRKWRTSMSGVAWCLTYRDGTVKRLIEAPRPRGPMSAAVFLHEIGHHAIGFNVYKPRCLEEYHAWRWSLEAMHAHGLNITDQVRYRMHASLWYAVAKAKRRGIKSLPAELEPYTVRPSRPRKAASR
jgi:hypothetical protein